MPCDIFHKSKKAMLYIPPRVIEQQWTPRWFSLLPEVSPPPSSGALSPTRLGFQVEQLSFFQLSSLIFHCKDFQYQNQFSSGPPRTRIAFAEKVAHGLLISAGVLAGGIFLHWCWTLVWKILTLLLRTDVDPCPHQGLQGQGLKNNSDILASPY